MGDDTVLVLGCASATPHGRDQMSRLTEQLTARGVKVVGADTAANLRVAGELGFETVELDVNDSRACGRWARETEIAPSAVFTFREFAVLGAATITEELGLPGNPVESVRLVRNKDLCRSELARNGIPQPSCEVVSDAAEARRFMRGTGQGPWIVKPKDGMGSAGVSLVEDPDSVDEAVRRLETNRPFLVETFVTGEEYSAEGVLSAGEPVVLGLTAKTTGKAFVESGHRMPADLDGTTAARAEAAVRDAVRAVGLTHGAFHVEFWVDGAEVVLGEMHARPGGDFIHAMLEHCRPGFELYGSVVEDLLGRGSSPPPAITRAAGVEYLLLSPGYVDSISGWPNVAEAPGLIAADLSVRVGERLGEVDASHGRHGVLVAGGDTPEDVERTLRRWKAALDITVR